MFYPVALHGNLPQPKLTQLKSMERSSNWGGLPLHGWFVLAVQWMVGYLLDNYVGDDRFYLMTVYTGLRSGAGTRSNVSFILTGRKADTGVRQLSDGERVSVAMNGGGSKADTGFRLLSDGERVSVPLVGVAARSDGERVSVALVRMANE